MLRTVESRTLTLFVIWQFSQIPCPCPGTEGKFRSSFEEFIRVVELQMKIQDLRDLEGMCTSGLFLVFPFKNVTGILLEIPCHFSSQLDLVAVWHKSTPNSMTTPCHLSRFYLFSILKHDMDFGNVHVWEFLWHLLRK